MNDTAGVTAAGGSAEADAAARRFATSAAASRGPAALGRAALGLAALGLAALGLAALSGCSSSHGAAAPKATVTVTAPASPAASGPATAPAAPAATVPVPGSAGPGPCPARYLQAKLGLAQGTAGSTYTVLEFKNIGPGTCTLYGFPGVSLAGGTPVNQIGLAAAESHVTPRRLVTLAPGAVANALLQIVHAGNYPAAKCGPVAATYLQIYPPNQTTPTYLAYTSPACAKPVPLLTVSVVQPGSGG